MRQAQARESAEGSGKPAERNQEAITTASTLAVLQESERNGQEARVEREAIEHCEPSRVLSGRAMALPRSCREARSDR